MDTNSNEEGTEVEDINIENEMFNEEETNAHENDFNEGGVPGKPPVFGPIDPNTLTSEQKSRIRKP